MNDNHFWLCCNILWVMLAGAVLFSCNHYVDSKRSSLVQMVIEGGITPAQAWCAIEGSSDSAAEMLACQKIFGGDVSSLIKTRLPEYLVEDVEIPLRRIE